MSTLADGQWHRMHPASPLLRGGIGFIAVLGVLLANFRDRLIGLFVPDVQPPGGYEEHDLITFLFGLGPLVFGLGLLAVMLLVLFGFWLSWRFATFRITEELVEVRSGILFRSHRKARLDRVQTVNIQRPFIGRIFGLGRMEISAAGEASVRLAYLRGSQCEQLRAEVLILASGARASDTGKADLASVGELSPQLLAGIGQAEGASVSELLAEPGAHGPGAPRQGVHEPGGPEAGLGALLERRVQELASPVLGEQQLRRESLVSIPLGRLAWSILLGGTSITLVLLLAAVIAAIVLGAPLWSYFSVVVIVIAVGSYAISRFTTAARYSIVNTDDGVVLGYGLLSVTTETIPPGRVHAIEVNQPLLWRPARWWSVRITQASMNRSSSSGNGNKGLQSVVLPVGRIDDVHRVLRVLLPSHDPELLHAAVSAGMTGRDDVDDYRISPPRARLMRWFSRRRNGLRIDADTVYLRRGQIWRSLSIVPLARVQAIGLSQGPMLRMLRLADLRVHTVPGSVTTTVGALDSSDAQGGFRALASRAIDTASHDTSHRWAAGGEGSRP